MFANLIYFLTIASGVMLAGLWLHRRTTAGGAEQTYSHAGLLDSTGFFFLLCASIAVILLWGFEFFLVLATAVSGLTWLADALWLARRRRAGAGKAGEPAYVEYSKSFFPVLIFVLLLRSFLVEPFRIPSGSMLPTLEVGDFILVNKFSYGLRLPVLHNKFLSVDDPERGDIVVFRYPEQPSLNYIKRVVGVPGDRVAYTDKQLYINGEAVEIDFVGPYNGEGRRLASAGIYEERLPGRDHRILLYPERPGANVAEFTVPEGRYFMMGDNRDDSRDSRVWGLLPEENLVGKAFFIWMHINLGGDGVELGRIGAEMR